MKSFDQQVADWARTKPADGAYDYHQPCGCALYQFLTDFGYPVQSVSGFHWTDTSGKIHWLNEKRHLEHTKASRAVFDRPWTFGALADRLSS